MINFFLTPELLEWRAAPLYQEAAEGRFTKAASNFTTTISIDF